MFGWLFGSNERNLRQDELPLKADIEDIKQSTNPDWTYVFIPQSFFKGMPDRDIAAWERKHFESGQGDVEYWCDVSDRGDVACFNSRRHAERFLSENKGKGFTIVNG